MTTENTMRFEAETQQLLEIVINSLYTEKEVFLRELISNASDAIDKRRFAALTDSALVTEDWEGKIRLIADKEAKTLTIIDNGIGMTKDEVISNIGTIARSGTHELIKNLEISKAEGLPTELIGRFGVGFYSCIMVSKKVTLLTRKAGTDSAVFWSYEGGAEYKITDSSKDEPGTIITLSLKDIDEQDGISDLTSPYVLKRIIKKYSDFVRYPIILPIERKEGEGEEEKTIIEDETINSMKAIWKRNESEVTDEERNEFYKHVSGDWSDPMLHFSMKAEGRLEYQTLMFIPSNAPFDMFSQSYKRGLQLYARNVKIMDYCEDVLPEHLRFVKGVLDAQDLPLNVSRETLQNNRQIATIKASLTKKIHSDLKKIKEKDFDTYLKFWNQFGAVLKEGISTDPASKERLIPLLLFKSTNDKEKYTTLEEYKIRMKEGQGAIYFITAESREIAENSPHLEAFLAKGYEVLLLTDPIDDFMVAGLHEYEGLELKSIGKGGVEIGNEEEKKELENKAKDFENFMSALKKHLEEQVSEVKLSSRLQTSPVCLVGTEGDLSPHIERMMRQSKLSIPTQKRILEINPNHEVIKKLHQKFEAGMKDEEVSENAQLLLGQALLAESSPLPDPAAFARLVASLMSR